MITEKVIGKKTISLLFFFLLIVFFDVLQASEVSSLNSLQKKIEILEKEILNLKMKNIVENKFEWQILKLSEIENDIKRLHNRFEILEKNYYNELKAVKGITNDMKERMLALEGKAPTDTETVKASKINDETPDNAENQSLISEESKIFNSALNLLNDGNLKEAEKKLSEFIEKFPGSSELSDAFFWRAEVRGRKENWIGAANDYLESFSLSPSGKNSPKTLFGLGVSLGAIGEKEQACLTLDEVSLRFPEIGAVLSQDIEKAKKLLNCE